MRPVTGYANGGLGLAELEAVGPAGGEDGLLQGLRRCPSKLHSPAAYRAHCASVTPRHRSSGPHPLVPPSSPSAARCARIPYRSALV